MLLHLTTSLVYASGILLGDRVFKIAYLLLEIHNNFFFII